MLISKLNATLQNCRVRIYFFLRKYRVAIVGSGPSAFYTAKYLLEDSSHANSKIKEFMKIDILESLPVPFGLARYGVAPDHPEVKSVCSQFQSLMLKHKNQLRFVGNIDVGKDIDIKTLKTLYDAIVIATGAQSDVNLNILPEENNHSVVPVPTTATTHQATKNDHNIYSARQFVNWYNGHPNYSTLFQPPPLSHVEDATSSNNSIEDINTSSGTVSRIEHVVIIGQGNVALDCARILACDKSMLQSTDISSIAYRTLFPDEPPENGTANSSSFHTSNNNHDDNCIHRGNSNSNSSKYIDFRQLKSITLVGRRGPLEMACTIKELRELTTLSQSRPQAQHQHERHVQVEISPKQVDEVMTRLTPQQLTDLNNRRPKKRMFELIQKIANKNNDNSHHMDGDNKDEDVNNCKIKFLYFRSPVSYKLCPQSQKINQLKVEINQGSYNNSNNNNNNVLYDSFVQHTVHGE